MIIRKSSIQDLDMIMQIIEDARISITKLGIDQWQYGYPSRDIVKDDIANGISYVVDDGEVCAVFALKDDGEPTYEKIYQGKWINNEKYVALHRIAITPSMRGTGLAGNIIDFIVKYCRENGFSSIKVDTHKGNIPMRKMLEKNGFSYCGVILLADKQKRVAYEKII